MAGISRFGLGLPLGGTGGGILLFWGRVAPLSKTAGNMWALKPLLDKKESTLEGQVEKVLFGGALEVLLLLWEELLKWNLGAEVEGTSITETVVGTLEATGKLNEVSFSAVYKSTNTVQT